MNLKEKRAAALKAAQEIVDRVKAAGRELTAQEQSQLEAKRAEITELDQKIEAAQKGTDLLNEIGALADPEASRLPGDGSGAPSDARLSLRALKANGPRRIMEKMTAGGHPGQKSLMPTGTAVVSTPLAPDPVSMTRPPTGVLDLIPIAQVAPVFAYLRQTERTNNAAPVAPGALKPTSIYGLTRVEDRLRVIAHVSEPIDKFWLSDNASLQRFVADELLNGLYQAVNAQVIGGDGIGENITGLLNTSGIQVQAYTTSEILTARAALTAVESLGFTASGFVLNPADWATIETSTLSAGNYVLTEAGSGLPVDRAARRLWGQPVALDTGIAVGTGLLLSADSVALNTEQGAPINIEWSSAVSDDFQRNQLRARCESRYALSVYQPAGVVSMDLTAA